ncbi:prepilin peptidase [Halalkalibacterium ligniniphilum]|uniref:prepilin peptidase n=1 Tax=Halalkalibacterium ligniniphilum TaxID=1134413 RepID=UPI00034C13E8|nr:A24 family peptidase [Halalkalibacterium ligniniphilum]
MEWFIAGYLFVLGLLLGSFYNVVGLRVPLGASIVKPRSHCPACQRTLTPLELIPVISYFMVKGRCQGCRTKISFMYPMVELSVGILFASVYLWQGLNGELIVALSFISLFAIIFVSDIRYMVIPDKVLLFFAPLLLVLRLTVAPLTPWWEPFVGAMLGFGLLLVIAVVSKGGMGGGDVKLFGVLGLVLGWEGILLTFLLSSFYGAAVGGVALATGRIKRGQPIPFAPFIMLGALTAYVFGELLIEWYVGRFFL